MTGLPAALYFTDAGRTNAEAKTGQDDMLAAQKETPGGAAISLLTISTGNVTPTGPVHNIDTEGATSSDDLANILQTNHPTGRMLLIRSTDNAREVVVKHNTTGAGEILLADGADFSMDNALKWLLLLREGVTWVEVLRGFGSDMAAFRAFLGLGTAAVANTGTSGASVPFLNGANTWSGIQTLAAKLACADQQVERPEFLDYAETVNVIGSIGGGTQDIDLTLGNVISGTIDTSTTTFTFSNAPADGKAGSFTLILTNPGSQTINWPASVKWPKNVPPILTVAGRDRLFFMTEDGGAIWDGSSLLDFS